LQIIILFFCYKFSDALPQVASLAISSANGLLLKGGKEAANTNKFLMGIVKEALGRYGCADAIAMVPFLS
jgi:delta-1-pyrroline-5-carboxylate synthetase